MRQRRWEERLGRPFLSEYLCLWVVKMLHGNFFFSELLQGQNERRILIPLSFSSEAIFLIPPLFFFGYFQTPEENRSSLRATSVLKVPPTPQP